MNVRPKTDDSHTPDRDELLDSVMGALDRLLKMFQVERYLHLTLGFSAFLLVLFCGFRLVTENNLDKTMLAALFGSSGLVTASSARITYFFNRAFTIVETVIKRVSR